MAQNWPQNYSVRNVSFQHATTVIWRFLPLPAKVAIRWLPLIVQEVVSGSWLFLKGIFQVKISPHSHCHLSLGIGLREMPVGTRCVPMNASSTACSWALVQGTWKWDRHPRLLWEKKVTAMKEETCGVTIQASGNANGISQLTLYPQLLLH